jgi:hypothetical protein
MQDAIFKTKWALLSNGYAAEQYFGQNGMKDIDSEN